MDIKYNQEMSGTSLSVNFEYRGSKKLAAAM
jgi:hypothetical protein